MRHHPEHVACLVDDTGDGARGPIRAPPLVGVGWTTDVAEYHPPFALQSIDCLVVRGVTAIAVRNGHQGHGAFVVTIGKHRISRSDTKSYKFADVLQTF